MPATRSAAIASGGKETIVTSGGCVRMVMPIAIGIAVRAVAITVPVRIIPGCRPFISMFIRAILVILRQQLARCGAQQRNCAEGKYQRLDEMLQVGAS